MHICIRTTEFLRVLTVQSKSTEGPTTFYKSIAPASISTKKYVRVCMCEHACAIMNMYMYVYNNVGTFGWYICL